MILHQLPEPVQLISSRITSSTSTSTTTATTTGTTSNIMIKTTPYVRRQNNYITIRAMQQSTVSALCDVAIFSCSKVYKYR